MIGMIWVAAALAGDPARYTLSAQVDLPPTGPALIDLTGLIATANRDDLLVVNGKGEQIPFRVIGSWEEQLGGCAPAPWDPVGPPPRYERIRIDTRPVGRTIDRIILDPGTVGSGLFSGALSVFFGDGAWAFPIEVEKNGAPIATALLWRANIAHAERENMVISVDALPPGEYDLVAPMALRWRGVQVCWTATTDIRPVELPLQVVGPMPAAPGRSRYEVILPGAGLDLMELTLNVSDERFAREVDVFTPRFSAGGSRFSAQMLNHTAIERLTLGGATIDHTTIAVDDGRGGTLGSRIILEIQDERDEALTITGATGRFSNRALLLLDAGEGPHTVYAAPFQAERGDYDLGHATVELLRQDPPLVRPLAFADNPSLNPAVAMPAQLLVGADADVRGYSASVEVFGDAPGKPTRWHLDAAAMADVEENLASLRLVNAEGKQVPYVLEDGDWESVQFTTERDEEGSLSRIRVTLAGRVRPSSVVLRTGDSVFSRKVSVGNGQGGNALWESGPNDGAAMLSLPLYGAMDSFEILIDNGDDAPLGELNLAVYAPTLHVLAVDPGPGAVLWWGNDRVQSPDYDLEMLADIMRLGVVAEGTLGPLQKHTRATSADRTLALVAVGALALVLLGMAILLVREPETPEGSGT